MNRVLLVDQDANHAEHLAMRLRQHGLAVVIVLSIAAAVQQLEQRIPAFEVVILAAEAPDRGIRALATLIASSRQSLFTSGPSFLFASRQRCSPQVRLRIERLGARHVRAG